MIAGTILAAILESVFKGIKQLAEEIFACVSLLIGCILSFVEGSQELWLIVVLENLKHPVALILHPWVSGFVAVLSRKGFQDGLGLVVRLAVLLEPRNPSKAWVSGFHVNPTWGTVLCWIDFLKLLACML